MATAASPRSPKKTLASFPVLMEPPIAVSHFLWTSLYRARRVTSSKTFSLTFKVFASFMRIPISARRWSNASSCCSMLTSNPRLVNDKCLMRSAYIVAHRCKDLDQSFAAGLLEIERVDLSLAIGSFELCVPGKGPVAAEFFRPLYRDLREAGEDMVLEDLEDRVLHNLRRAERLLAFLPDLILAVGDRDIVAL